MASRSSAATLGSQPTLHMYVVTAVDSRLVCAVRLDSWFPQAGTQAGRQLQRPKFASCGFVQYTVAEVALDSKVRSMLANRSFLSRGPASAPLGMLAPPAVPPSRLPLAAVLPAPPTNHPVGTRPLAGFPAQLSAHHYCCSIHILSCYNSAASSHAALRLFFGESPHLHNSTATQAAAMFARRSAMPLVALFLLLQAGHAAAGKVKSKAH